MGDSIGLVVGDLNLSGFEDELSAQWPGCLDGRERSFREYRRAVLVEDTPASVGMAEDPYCAALLKHHHSLMPMAQEARKPMFGLKPADGAIGAHQQAVLGVYRTTRPWRPRSSVASTPGSARSGTRTRTPSRTAAFEAAVSANSTIRANGRDTTRPPPLLLGAFTAPAPYGPAPHSSRSERSRRSVTGRGVIWPPSGLRIRRSPGMFGSPSMLHPLS